MPTSRSYRDGCGIARALDVVGERWALLIVRELILSPQRFTDLRRALPGASSNILADRLRELEASEVVRRRKLAPPAGSTVYELTEWGQELEPILISLGCWGLRVPRPSGSVTISAGSVLIYLRTAARPDPAAAPTTYRLELDDRVWTVRTEAGRLWLESGEPADAEAGLRTDPATLNGLFDDPATLDATVAAGTAAVDGDADALRRLLDAMQAPAE